MIDISGKALKFLKRESLKQRRQLWKRIEALETDPRPNDSIHMTGYPGDFRIDVGEFRVIYSFSRQIPEGASHGAAATVAIDENNATLGIKILVVDRRNDKAAYKALRRKRRRG